MASSRLSRRILRAVLLLLAPAMLVVAGILILLYVLGIQEHPAVLLAVVFAGIVVLAAYLTFMLHAMGDVLGATLRDMQLGTELIAGMQPEHRLQVRTSDELETLANAINRLADRVGAARVGVETAVARATHELAEERAMLVAVLESLGEGVLLVSGEGRVVLANPAAQRLMDPGGFALLGRSLFDVIHAEDLPHLRERFRHGRGFPMHFAFQVPDGGMLEATLTSYAGRPRHQPGFLFVLRESAQHSDLRRLLPRDNGGPRLLGIGARASGGERIAAPERPALYDFSCLMRRVDTERRERALAELDYVVFDTEATGLDRHGDDRIVSLAGVRVRAGEVRRGEFFDTLVNPAGPIPPSSVAYHGITEAMVAEAPTIDAVLPRFLQFLDGGLLVGHQVWFDLRLLVREAGRLGLSAAGLTHSALDTQLLAAAAEPALADLGLDALADRLGVSVEGRHSALGDALATAEIYVCLLHLLRARGIITLGQALDVSAGVRRS